VSVPPVIPAGETGGALYNRLLQLFCRLPITDPAESTFPGAEAMIPVRQSSLHHVLLAAVVVSTLVSARAFSPSEAAPPVISSFTATRGAVGSVAPWRNDFLHWSVAGATSVAIDQGIGDVTAVPYSTVTVNPGAPTRYTLTATNGAGSVSASVLVDYLPLVQVAPDLYQTEHAIYLVADASQVAFPDYTSVFSWANIDNVYVPRLKAAFPADYFMVVVAANNVTPNNVPIVTTTRHIADGIGQASITGVGVPNICRYNMGGGTSVDYAVFDHEIGHNWSAFIGIEVGSGHWYANTTVGGQMSATYSDDNWATVKEIAGTSAAGFTWSAADNSARNETEVFADQDLYAMGLHPIFPDTYVLNGAVYNPDHSMSYTSAAKYGHAWAVGKNGPRQPGYQAAQKQFRLGFVYVARDLAEIQNVYFGVERSIAHFENAEQVDTVRQRFQVPFLVETKFRASVSARLADLDGNRAPTIALPSPGYLISTDGAAVIPFVTADPDGTAPAVSVLPASLGAVVGSGHVTLAGLAPGTHFLTIKAEDAMGKKAFAHAVVDVVVPGVYAFTPQAGAAVGTTVTSNAVTLSGIPAGTAVSASGGTYSVNGGAFTGLNGVVHPGDSVRLRLTSASAQSATVAATLLVGYSSGTFSVTTQTLAPSRPTGLRIVAVGPGAP
jgi:hypothetical protein